MNKNHDFMKQDDKIHHLKPVKTLNNVNISESS